MKRKLFLVLGAGLLSTAILVAISIHKFVVRASSAEGVVVHSNDVGIHWSPAYRGWTLDQEILIHTIQTEEKELRCENNGIILNDV